MGQVPQSFFFVNLSCFLTITFELSYLGISNFFYSLSKKICLIPSRLENLFVNAFPSFLAGTFVLFTFLLLLFFKLEICFLFCKAMTAHKRNLKTYVLGFVWKRQELQHTCSKAFFFPLLASTQPQLMNSSSLYLKLISAVNSSPSPFSYESIICNLLTPAACFRI